MGQLVAPQNTAVIPSAPPKDWDRPSSGPTTVPKAAPVKSTGTISPAAEAGPQSEGGKDQLEQERLRDGLARQHPAG